MIVRRVEAAEPALLGGLCDLLADSVHGGASVGFLAPLARSTAERYWSGVFAALREGLVLWVAQDGASVVGSVQLDPCRKDNGRHRAEVQKLFVRTSHRGRGVASRLLRELEHFARASGRTLLVLDTQAGSHAEGVYRHLGWQRAGEIPGYAAAPDGALHPTAYYFKALAGA
jgi:ribosomal protein S18 acetylase RimI-like enzyme